MMTVLKLASCNVWGQCMVNICRTTYNRSQHFNWSQFYQWSPWPAIGTKREYRIHGMDK